MRERERLPHKRADQLEPTPHEPIQSTFNNHHSIPGLQPSNPTFTVDAPSQAGPQIGHDFRMIDVHSQERAVSRSTPPGALLVQRQAAPAAQPPAASPTAAPTSTKPKLINIALGPDSAVVFKSASASLGGITVHITGRMAVKGKASLIGEELPAKGADKALLSRTRQLLAAGFSAAVPTGDAKKLTLSLAGETISLELADGAEKSPAFQVAGHFSAAGRTLTLPSCEVTGAEITLDATVWVAPASTPGGPAATPTVTPGDASAKSFSFAGKSALFGGGKDRTGGVTLKSNMDAFEAQLPDFVKNHKFLQLPEQRAAFFQEMRSYFGTDERTVAHFAKLRKANVKGATTILHDEAATRLEKVQAELGEANMPKSGGVGWPRSECKLGGAATLKNLHNLGFAVDYNAYQAPNLQDRRTLDLISIVAGRPAHATYQQGGVNRDEVGKTYTHGTDDEKAKLDADPKVQKWLEQVRTEAESVSKASEDFRASLKSKDAAGAEIDLAPELMKLRDEWFAAKKEDRPAILAKLPAVIKPWLDKVDAQQKAMEAKITAAGLDPAKLPGGDALDQATDSYKKLATRIKALQDKLGTPLKRGQRTQIDQFITQARKLLTQPETPLADDTAAVDELKRLHELIDKHQTAFGQKKWLERVVTLRTALTTDGSLVFGTEKKAVVSPGLAQITDTGFYNLAGKAKAGPEAFSSDFVQKMVKYGFNHLGTWNTPDSMHFELRWDGPGTPP